jgi:hypothetical protein
MIDYLQDASTGHRHDGTTDGGRKVCLGDIDLGTTNTADLGSTTVAAREVFTRSIDTDGAQTLVIQTNNIDRMSLASGTQDSAGITFNEPVVLNMADRALPTTANLAKDGLGNMILNVAATKGWRFESNAVLALEITSGGAITTVGSITMTGNITPEANKARSVGVTGTRFLDGFFGNAITSGTSRTVELKQKCLTCNVNLKKTTGGVVRNGYEADYVDAWCPNCLKLHIVPRLHANLSTVIPKPDKARFISLETGCHGGLSNYILVRFEYEYGTEEYDFTLEPATEDKPAVIEKRTRPRKYVNATFLETDEERAIMSGTDKVAKQKLLEEFARIEWESTYRIKIMEEQAKALAATFKTKHLHAYLGKEVIWS